MPNIEDMWEETATPQLPTTELAIDPTPMGGTGNIGDLWDEPEAAEPRAERRPPRQRPEPRAAQAREIGDLWDEPDTPAQVPAPEYGDDPPDTLDDSILTDSLPIIEPEKRQPASQAWVQARTKYNRLHSPVEKVEVLDAWMSEYLPAERRRAYKEAGEPGELHGLWKFLDRVDKWTDRMSRAGPIALWEARKKYFKTGEYVGPKEMWGLMKESWENDRGDLEDGTRALKALKSYTSSIIGMPGATMRGMSEADFLAQIEADTEADFASMASWIDKSGIGRPITSVGMAGLAVGSQLIWGGENFKSMMEARSAMMEQEAYASGEAIIGFVGLATISHLNALGGKGIAKTVGTRGTRFGSDVVTHSLAQEKATLKGIMDAQGGILDKGMISLREASEAGDSIDPAMGRIIETLADDPVLDVVAKQEVDEYLTELAELTRVRDEMVAAGGDAGAADASLASLQADMIEKLSGHVDSYKQRAPARMEANVTAQVEARYLDAVDTAFRHEVPLYGAESINVLNKLKHGAVFEAALDGAAEAVGLSRAELLAKTKSGDNVILSEALGAMGVNAGDLPGHELKAEALWAELMRQGHRDKKLLKDIDFKLTGEVDEYGHLVVRPEDVKITWQTPAEAKAELLEAGMVMPKDSAIGRAMAAPGQELIEAVAKVSGRGDEFARTQAFRQHKMLSASDALGHKMAYAALSKFPPFVEAITRNAWSIGSPRKVTHFYGGTEAAVRGTPRPKILSRRSILHPAKFARMEARTRAQHVTRGVDRERLGLFVQRVLAISKDPRIQNLAVLYREMGWTDELTEQQIIALAHLERVEHIVSQSDLGRNLDEIAMDTANVSDDEMRSIISGLRTVLDPDSPNPNRPAAFPDTALAGEDHLQGITAIVGSVVDELEDAYRNGGAKKRKKALRAVAVQTGVIRRALTDVLTKEHELSRMIKGWEQAAPMLEEGKELRTLRKSLLGAVRGKWDEDAPLEDVVRRIQELQASYDSKYGAVHGELAALRTGLPPGGKSTWAQHRTNLRDSMAARFGDEQVDELVMPLLDQRAKTWASYHGVHPDQADAWYAKTIRDFQTAETYDAWDKGQRATGHNTELSAETSGGMYSALEVKLQDFPKPKATVQEVLGFLRKQGVKQEELDDMSFFASLDPGTKVTKAEMLEEFERSQRPWTEHIRTDNVAVKTAKERQLASELEVLNKRIAELEKEADPVDNIMALLGGPEEGDELTPLYRQRDRLAADLRNEASVATESRRFEDVFRSEVAEEVGDSLSWVERISPSSGPPDLFGDMSAGGFEVRYVHRGNAFGETLSAVDEPDAFAAFDGLMQGRDRYDHKPAQDRTTRSKNAWTREGDPDGGTGYTERVYTLDELKEGEETFTTGHFVTDENVFLHIRYDFVTGADGKKELRLIEVQSDLHQKGRSTGYGPTRYETPDDINSRLDDIRSDPDFSQLTRFEQGEWARVTSDEMFDHLDAMGDFEDAGSIFDVLVDQLDMTLDTQARNATKRLVAKYSRPGTGKTNKGLPSAPFKKSWRAFALKQAVKAAVEEGAERVLWLSGDEVTRARSANANLARITYDEELPRAAKKLYKRHGARPRRGRPALGGIKERLRGEGIDIRPEDKFILMEDGSSEIYSVAKSRDEAVRHHDEAFRVDIDAPEGAIEIMPLEEGLARWAKANGIPSSPVGNHILDLTPELRASVSDKGQTLYSAAFDDFKAVQSDVIRAIGDTEDLLRDIEAQVAKLAPYEARAKTARKKVDLKRAAIGAVREAREMRAAVAKARAARGGLSLEGSEAGAGQLSLERAGPGGLSMEGPGADPRPTARSEAERLTSPLSDEETAIRQVEDKLLDAAEAEARMLGADVLKSVPTDVRDKVADLYKQRVAQRRSIQELQRKEAQRLVDAIPGLDGQVDYVSVFTHRMGLRQGELGEVVVRLNGEHVAIPTRDIEAAGLGGVGDNLVTYSELQTKSMYAIRDANDSIESLRSASLSRADLQFQGNTSGVRGVHESMGDLSQKTIAAFASADINTLIHELGHLMRRDIPLTDLNVLSSWVNANPKVKQMGTVTTVGGKWVGLDKKGKKNDAVLQAAEEMFAEGFVQYLKKGKAPVKELETAFARAKQWLRDIFTAIVSLRLDGKRRKRPLNINVELGHGAIEAMDNLFIPLEGKAAKAAAAKRGGKAKALSDYRAAEAARKVEIEARPVTEAKAFSKIEDFKNSPNRGRGEAAKVRIMAKTGSQVFEEIIERLPVVGDELKEAFAKALLFGSKIDLPEGGTWLDTIRTADIDTSSVSAFNSGDYGKALRTSLLGGRADRVAKIEGFLNDLRKAAVDLEDALKTGSDLPPLEVAPSIATAVGAKSQVSTIWRQLAEEQLPWLDQVLKDNQASVKQTMDRANLEAKAMAAATADQEVAELLARAVANQDYGEVQKLVAQSMEAGRKGVKRNRSKFAHEKKPVEGDLKQLDDMLKSPEAIKDLEVTMDWLGWNTDSPQKMWDALRHGKEFSASHKARMKEYRTRVLKSWRDHETARQFKTLTKREQEMVKRVLKNPAMYRIPDGLSPEVAKKAAARGMKRTVGEDLDPKALEIAEVLDEFFEGYLQKLRHEHGGLANFDKDEFLTRVDVAAYVPHILTSMARDKVQRLKNAGTLPKNFDPMFLERRGIKGTIEAINDQMRRSLATSALRSKVKAGKLDAAAFGLDGPAMRHAAENNTLSELLTPEVYDQLVNEMIETLDVGQGFDFFEVEPMLLMEHYATQVDRSLSDASYLRDMMEMFPMGRKFSEMDQANAATGRPGELVEMAAEAAGYSKLSHNDYLATLANLKLPKQLRKYGEYIRGQIVQGKSPNEIMRLLHEQGVTVDLEWIASFRAPPVYLPIPVVEYLQWINRPDKGGAGTEFLDGILSWAKGMATVSSLAHISMNVFGNILSVMQLATLKDLRPKNLMKAFTIFAKRPPDHPSWGQMITLGDKTMSAKDWRTRLQFGGALDVPGQSAFREEMLGRALVSPASDEAGVGKRMVGAVGGAAVGAAIGGAVGGVPGAMAGGFLGQWPGAALGQAVTAGTGLKGVGGVVGEDVEKLLTAFAEMKGKDRVKLPWMDEKRFRKGGKATKRFVQYGGEYLSGAGAGAVIGSTLGPMGTAFGAIVGGLTFPSYMRLMSDMNTSAEQMSRAALAVARLDAGDSFDESMLAVDRALRNYSYIGPIEKTYLRRLLFFSTWELGNMRFQVEQLFKNPWQAKRIQTFLNGLYKKDFTEEELQSLPEYLRWQVVLRTGASKVLTLRGVPQTSALEFATKWKDVPTGVLQRLRPDLLTALEFTIGQESVYYGRGWDELTNVRQLKMAPPLLKSIAGVPSMDADDEMDQPHEVSVWKDGKRVGTKLDYRTHSPRNFYIMQKLPGWRVLREYMSLVTDSFQSRALDAGDADAGATPEERLLYFGLGFRPQNVDWETQQMYMQKRFIARLLEQAEYYNKNTTMNFTKLGKGLDAPGELITPEQQDEIDRLEELGLE